MKITNTSSIKLSCSPLSRPYLKQHFKTLQYNTTSQVTAVGSQVDLVLTLTQHFNPIFITTSVCMCAMCYFYLFQKFSSEVEQVRRQDKSDQGHIMPPQKFYFACTDIRLDQDDGIVTKMFSTSGTGTRMMQLARLSL